MSLFDSWKSTGSGREHRSSSGRAVLFWLWLPTAIAALRLRFSALGETVLTPAEACNAWPAWASAHGVNWHHVYSHPHVTSALLDNLLWLSFQGVEASDAVPRVGPAIVGSLIVFLPWFLRRWLGNWGAFSAMILLAFDSWHLAFSRRAEGAIFSLFFALAILAWIELSEEAPSQNSPRRLPARAVWMVLAGIVALFAASSIEFWSLAPPLVAYFALTGGWSRLCKYGDSESHLRGSIEELTVVFAGSLLLALSCFGARWGNLLALGSGLTEWLRSWGTATAHAYGPGWMLVRIVREQPLTLAAGLPGLAVVWLGLAETDSARARKRALALSFWILWGVILTVQGGRGPAGLLVIHLPLNLAAAVALGRLVSEIAAGCHWREWLTRIFPAVGLLTAVLIWVLRYHRSASLSTPYIRLSLVLAASAILFFILVRRIRFGPELATVLIIALGVAQLNGSWQLGRRIDTEPVFFEAVGHPDVRILESDVRQWLVQYREEKRDTWVSVDGDTPGGYLPAWYLRDFLELANSRAGDDAGRNAVIVNGEGNAECLGAGFAQPVPYRIDVRRPAAPEPGRPLTVQTQSEVVFLWLPRE